MSIYVYLNNSWKQAGHDFGGLDLGLVTTRTLLRDSQSTKPLPGKKWAN